MDGMCRDNVLTHNQGFGADQCKKYQYKALTVYLCHEEDDLTWIATTTSCCERRLNDEEKGWVVDG